MAKPLTPIAIANLRARPQRYEVSDPGCAGLRVVIFPSKKKSFIVRFRFRGLQRKLTLGPCLITPIGATEPDTAPELDTPLSLAAARELTTKALRVAKSGTDDGPTVMGPKCDHAGLNRSCDRIRLRFPIGACSHEGRCGVMRQLINVKSTL